MKKKPLPEVPPDAGAGQYVELARLMRDKIEQLETRIEYLEQRIIALEGRP